MILGEKIKQMYELTYKHIFISQGILIRYLAHTFDTFTN